LQDVGVLVTRPEHQAIALCRLLEEHGARTVRLPAIDIKPLASRDIAARLGPLSAFDAVIFTSANAVRFGAALLDLQRDLTLGALGPATAHALNQAGYQVAVQSNDSIDSEGLLKHPRLEHCTGRRILLIKGVGGRPFLAQQLTQRGAQIVTADVYERLPARADEATLAAICEQFAGGALRIVTATSVEIAGNLLAMATAALREELKRVHWLVAGARVAAGVREHGIAAPLLQAASADDQDLLAELLRWRASASGA
jgi:uroporphyrinogen-III synthase